MVAMDCNDDDAERSSLVACERATATSTPASGRSNKDNSISLTPQKEHYQGCLKLYAENKITKDNAWSLQLIDFMSAMLRRRDRRMDDLQTASTVVDASARIYSYRVDAVHHDVLLMAGGLTRAAHSKRGKKGEEGEGAGAEEEGAGGEARARRRRRLRGALAAPDALAADFDTDLGLDPFFERLAATAGDVTSSGRAFHATLPVHDRTLALLLSTEGPFLRPAGAGAGAAGAGGARLRLARRLAPALAAADALCEPFAGFSIARWDADAEDAEWSAGAGAGAQLNLSQQAVAFDADAEPEPVPLDAELADPLEEEPPAGLASDEEADACVAACAARAAPARPARLADMRPGAAADARLEYSYCAVRAAWAGPRHWRLKHNRASRASTAEPAGSLPAAGAGTGAARARARRGPEFPRAGLAFDWRAPPAPDYAPAPPARIMISRKTLATGPAWSEHNYRTPVDRGLDESFFLRLFVRRRAALRRRGAADAPDAADVPDAADEARPYDYGNENDASYCPLAQEGSEWGPDEEEGAARRAARPEPAEPAELLEPPPKVAKIFIPYAMRAKKVDMKQLKAATWRLLTEPGAAEPGAAEPGAEHVAPTSFHQVYARLGGALGAGARAALSVPLALLALLHLANERGLRLQPRADLADVAVLGRL